MIACVVLLAACASNRTQVAAPDTFVQPDVPARMYAGVAGQGASDRCGAQSMAWLVGRPRTEIPVPVDLSNRWVRSTAAPAPPGVRPERLNIVFDPVTQRVQAVACG